MVILFVSSIHSRSVKNSSFLPLSAMSEAAKTGPNFKAMASFPTNVKSTLLESISNITMLLNPSQTAIANDTMTFDEFALQHKVTEEQGLEEMRHDWRNQSMTDTWSFLTNSWFIYFVVYFIRCLIIPCLLFYISLILWELRFLRMRDPSNPLPLPQGSMGLPFIGEMFQFFLIGTRYQRERQRQYGNVYKTHMFGRPTVMAVGDQYVRRLLLGEGQIVNTLWPSTTRKILGEHGIVNGNKQTHTTIKRLALRIFSPKHMGKYAPIVQDGIVQHVKTWEGKLPVLEMCKQVVSKTMMSVLLGINPHDPAIKDFIQAADDIVDSIFSLPFNIPGFAFHRGLKAKEFVFKNLEQKLRSKIEASDEELFASSNEVESVLLNIIKLARKEGTKIELINLQNLSLEFIFAGTQSLQCASASMIVHLSQRPQVVARLREEISAHGLWDRPMNKITFEEIQSLKFADCVIKETMRVTPSIPGCVRVAAKTFELGGYQVPKGWQIVYSIKLTHETTVGKALQNGGQCEFDPDEYFNCQKCAPNHDRGANNSDTALSSDSSKQNKEEQKNSSNIQEHVCNDTAGEYSYIPFGKGARMCAGKNYGMLFLRVLLFELVRTTNFKLSGKLKFSAVPMTKPHKSVMIEFEKMKK